MKRISGKKKEKKKTSRGRIGEVSFYYNCYCVAAAPGQRDCRYLLPLLRLFFLQPASSSSSSFIVSKCPPFSCCPARLSLRCPRRPLAFSLSKSQTHTLPRSKAEKKEKAFILGGGDGRRKKKILSRMARQTSRPQCVRKRKLVKRRRKRRKTYFSEGYPHGRTHKSAHVSGYINTTWFSSAVQYTKGGGNTRRHELTMSHILIVHVLKLTNYKLV